MITDENKLLAQGYKKTSSGIFEKRTARTIGEKVVWETRVIKIDRNGYVVHDTTRKAK